jgi:SAM-dependent methyltransferase
VTDLYRGLFPPGGAVLDLMSSWVSHLPPEVGYGEVVGHGLNAHELEANPRLTRVFVQDLNADPTLPLADRSMDAAGCCVSVQYLQAPVDVFREVRRVLKAGAPFAVTFSNRCFPTKAVAIWQALTGDDQARLVALYLERAGFTGVETRSLIRPGAGGDPLWGVVGRAPTI